MEVELILIGNYNGEINPNPEEIGNFKWITMKELLEDIKNNPQNYTPWFKIILEKGKDKLFINTI